VAVVDDGVVSVVASMRIGSRDRRVSTGIRGRRAASGRDAALPLPTGKRDPRR
jgi:hypothetical protein